MVNIVLPITNNEERYRELLDGLSGDINTKVLIGVSSSKAGMIEGEYHDIENFDIFVFEDKNTKEEIINYLQDYLEKGPIVVLRRAIKLKELDKMLSLERDVVTCKKERGKFASFMFSLWQKLLLIVLSVRLYPGDTSAICFGQDIAEVVRVTGNLSYSSRVNRWKGLKQSVIVSEGKAEKVEADSIGSFKLILAALLLIVIGICVTVCVCLFAKISIIIGLLLFCLDAICLSVAGICIIMVIFNNSVGKRKNKPAILIRRKGGNEKN